MAPITLLGVALVVFALVDLSPNDPARAALGIYADADARAEFAFEHGLNDPFVMRYARFLGDVIHLDLGVSFRSESVSDLLLSSLPVTVQLILLSSIFAILGSITLGTMAAVWEGRWPDRIIGVVSAVCQASPPFFVGIMVVQIFAVSLDLIPPSGYVALRDGVMRWFLSMIAPAVVLSLPFLGGMTRVVRSSYLQELQEDYVRTATALGISRLLILSNNVLRNALITPATVAGLYIGALISGAVLVEVVFDLPGLGTLLVAGVNSADLGIVRGVAIITAVGFVVINLIVDLLYLRLNPQSAEAGAQ